MNRSKVVRKKKGFECSDWQCAENPLWHEISNQSKIFYVSETQPASIQKCQQKNEHWEIPVCCHSLSSTVTITSTNIYHGTDKTNIVGVARRKKSRSINKYEGFELYCCFGTECYEENPIHLVDRTLWYWLWNTGRHVLRWGYSCIVITYQWYYCLTRSTWDLIMAFTFPLVSVSESHFTIHMVAWEFSCTYYFPFGFDCSNKTLEILGPTQWSIHARASMYQSSQLPPSSMGLSLILSTQAFHRSKVVVQWDSQALRIPFMGSTGSASSDYKKRRRSGVSLVIFTAFRVCTSHPPTTSTVDDTRQDSYVMTSRSNDRTNAGTSSSTLALWPFTSFFKYSFSYSHECISMEYFGNNTLKE